MKICGVWWIKCYPFPCKGMVLYQTLVLQCKDVFGDKWKRVKFRRALHVRVFAGKKSNWLGWASWWGHQKLDLQNEESCESTKEPTKMFPDLIWLKKHSKCLNLCGHKGLIEFSTATTPHLHWLCWSTCQKQIWSTILQWMTIILIS